MVAVQRQASQRWYTAVFWIRTVKALIVILITVFTLTACGQAGPLRPAPEPVPLPDATETAS